MIKVAHIRRTCPACPAQWEGATDDGLYVYVRYRWGWLKAEVGGVIEFHQRTGAAMDGFMEDDEMHEHLKDVLDFSGCGSSHEELEEGLST